MGLDLHRMGNWRNVVALAALLAVGWGLSALLYFGPFGGADAEAPRTYRDEHLRLAVEGPDGQWYTVAIDFLMHDDGHGDFEAEADAARRSILARFPGAVEIPRGEVSAQFVQNGFWWPARTVAWSYNPAGKPQGLAGDGPAIAAAASSWDNAGSNWHFSGGGTTSANTAACRSSASGLDGRNTVGWGAQPGSVLAVTCTWYGTGNPAAAVEFDMEIDPDWHWTTGSDIDIDLRSVVTHELGHALGLNHSDVADAVMAPSYCAGCDRRTLRADDLAGIVAVYGAAATPTATPAPARTPAPVATPAPPAESLPLLPGANLVSWPDADAPPAAALAAQAGTISAVYGFDRATGTWQRYFPGLPSYTGSLPMLRRGEAYWIMASRQSAIVFAPQSP